MCAEQAFLNSVYGENFEELSFDYNGNIAAAVQNRTFWMLHRPNLKLLHFTWIKPFDPRAESLEDYKLCANDIKLWWRETDLRHRYIGKSS
jgi:hypothetical protein